ELQNTSDRDDISLTDASQLDTDFPVKSSDSDPTIGPVDQSVGGSLTLYLESGETCRLRLNTSTDYGQCLLALYSIMNKNKLLRGYPDIEHAWIVTVRYKIRATQIPLASLMASGFTNSIGRRFLCLTISEFLIVHSNLRQPEMVCPYSFVRQCASRRDGQFRLFLGRASPMGECEVAVQMSNAAIARSAHELFVKLMNQSGARYHQFRSSFVDNVNTELTEQFPRLPRPSLAVIRTESNDPQVIRIGFGTPSSAKSDESKRSARLSEANTRSWYTLSRENSHPTPIDVSVKNQSSLGVRRVKSFILAESLRAGTAGHRDMHSRRRIRSTDGRVCITGEKSSLPKSICSSIATTPLIEACDHYVEMTDHFDASENTPHQMTLSGHSVQESGRPRHASSPGVANSVQVTLRCKSHIPWSVHRSPLLSSVSVASTNSISNRPSRPMSHRGDDTLFADVVCDPQSGILNHPNGKTRQSLTLLHSDSGCWNRQTNRRNSISMFCHGVHPRLRTMSDVTSTTNWDRSALRSARRKLSDIHFSHPTQQPLDPGTCRTTEGQNASTGWRFSFASFLSSPVDSSTRNSCTTAACCTPASCSNLQRSQDLIQILEVGYENNSHDLAIQSRPRAHTVGSSLLIGSRLAATKLVCKPHVIRAPRHPRLYSPKETMIELNTSDHTFGRLLAYNSTHADQNRPSCTLSFADHYAL
ncbi:hypothetical protein FBUS_03082, partial [Fasciolopsis buskii]